VASTIQAAFNKQTMVSVHYQFYLQLHIWYYCCRLHGTSPNLIGFWVNGLYPAISHLTKLNIWHSKNCLTMFMHLHGSLWKFLVGPQFVNMLWRWVMTLLNQQKRCLQWVLVFTWLFKSTYTFFRSLSPKYLSR
jgi:hypothetical protein